jgi:hypothetical protein
MAIFSLFSAHFQSILAYLQSISTHLLFIFSLFIFNPLAYFQPIYI